jgi:hypothetical protein
MEYLSVENFQLLIKVLDITTDEKSKLLYHIMSFISKQNKTIIEGNKLTINLFCKERDNKKTINPLEQMDIPEAIKRSFTIGITEQRNDPIYFNKNDNGEYIQNLYKKTNDYYQNFEIPDGIDQSILITEKSKELEQLEKDLFNFYQREITLVLDSRDRNHDNFVNSNEYRLNLNQSIYNIHTITVLSAEIPKSGYVINNTNNTLYFQETNGTTLEATIDNGNYSITEVLSLLQAGMNSVGSSNYTISLVNDRVKITSDLTAGDNIFKLIFNGGIENTVNYKRSLYYKNNIGNLLGFIRINLSGSSNYTATKLYDVNGIKNLYLSFPKLNYNRYYNNDGFAKIIMSVPNNTICYYKEEFKQEFIPEIRRIDSLDFKWTDYHDNLYDFNGLEHSITIKFICYNTR